MRCGLLSSGAQGKGASRVRSEIKADRDGPWNAASGSTAWPRTSSRGPRALEAPRRRGRRDDIEDLRLPPSHRRHRRPPVAEAERTRAEALAATAGAHGQTPRKRVWTRPPGRTRPPGLGPGGAFSGGRTGAARGMLCGMRSDQAGASPSVCGLDHARSDSWGRSRTTKRISEQSSRSPGAALRARVLVHSEVIRQETVYHH